MKRCCLFVGVFIVIASAFAQDEEPVLAHVIDSSTGRIPVQTVAPEYPREARRDRVEGEVRVCFEVTREGKTRRIAVRTSTHRDFEKPSIKAVRASSFRPIGKDEPLAAIKFCRTFIFSLEPAEAEDDAALDAGQTDYSD
jgi:TonB family protein